jgi:hypothetical protein
VKFSKKGLIAVLKYTLRYARYALTALAVVGYGFRKN